MEPISKAKFSQTNNTYGTNGSLLMDVGLLSLNQDALQRTTKSSKNRSMSATGDCWDKPGGSGVASFFRRNSKMRTKTIYGSGGYETNISVPIGTYKIH